MVEERRLGQSCAAECVQTQLHVGYAMHSQIQKMITTLSSDMGQIPLRLLCTRLQLTIQGTNQEEAEEQAEAWKRRRRREQDIKDTHVKRGFAYPTD